MAGRGLVSELAEELHTLSQPLSTLRCRLDIAAMLGDEASAKEAVQGGLEDLDRILESIRRLRERLAEETSVGAPSASAGGTLVDR
jgi:hypothetical protein